MRPLRLLAWSAWLALAGTLTAGEPTRRPLNILWVLAENIGPDFGSYGTRQVRTPHLDRFAAEGVRYTRAFATAPVCSTSRSALATGLYQTTIGAHHHRSNRTPGIDAGYRLPAGVRPISLRMMDAGFYTANVFTLDGRRITNGKTDLNFAVDGPVLRPGDEVPPPGTAESSRQNFANSARLFHTTEWSALKARQPFYAQITLPNVDRNALGWRNYATNPRHADPAQVELPVYYPDTPVVRRDWADYLDSVSGLDVQFGEVIQRLEKDGMADDTIVFFFGDNGRQEARGLDWCYDSGLRVPLLVRWPKNHPRPASFRPGTVSGELVVLIDVTATTLALAGLTPPPGMHGRIFVGPQAAPPPRHVFGARDRTDDAVQRIRTVRTERYRYIRNFMPEKPFMARHLFKDVTFPVYRVLREYAAAGKLTPAQATLMLPRLPDEELYDVEHDPFEVNNLAGSRDPAHQRVLAELRGTLERWIEESNDQGRFPESPAAVQFWIDEAKEQHGRHEKP